MWKHNLNRQITKLKPALKISAFLMLWNGVFHGLTMSILLYWSLSSSRVPELARITTLNQFWAENQILFAALCGVTGSLFFRNQIGQLVDDRADGFRWLGIHAFRGFAFALVMVIALVLRRRYQFLGLSTQLNLNFLSSYAWILRSFLIFSFILTTEFLTRRVLHGPTWIRVLTQITIFWIWFFPSWSEIFSLVVLSLLFNNFWASTGFLTAIFIVTHAIFGLPFFENEFSGIFQIRSTRAEETFLQNPYLQVTLVALLVTFRYAKLLLRKESPTT